MTRLNYSLGVIRYSGPVFLDVLELLSDSQVYDPYLRLSSQHLGGSALLEERWA